jgi:hypothetical protein
MGAEKRGLGAGTRATVLVLFIITAVVIIRFALPFVGNPGGVPINRH